MPKYNISKCRTVYEICGGHMHEVQYVLSRDAENKTVDATSLADLERQTKEYADTLKTDEFPAKCFSIMVFKPNGTRAFPGFKKASEGKTLRFNVNDEQAQKMAICQYFIDKKDKPNHPARQYDQLVDSFIDAGRYPRPSEDEIHAYKNWLIENQLAV